MNLLIVFILLSTLPTCICSQVCGTPFIDPLSSASRAHTVVTGTLIEATRLYSENTNYNAQFRIENVLKSKSPLDESLLLVVEGFTEHENDEEACHFADLSSNVKYILFLKSSQDSNNRISAFPIRWSATTENEIREFLCNTGNQEAPVATATESVVNGNFRENVAIECTSTGKPAPLMRWWYAGKSVVSNKKYIIQNNGNTSILTLVHASHSWHGLYTCEAYSILGSSNASIQVNIQLYNITIEADHSIPCPAHMDNNYCYNNATCHIIVYTGMRSCRCRPGSTGLRCESYWDYDENRMKPMDKFLKMDLKFQLLLLLPVIIGTLVIALVIAIFAISRNKYQKARYFKASQHPTGI